MPDGFPRGRPASLCRLFCLGDTISESLDEPLICSAKGCRQPARWALLWNNPKLHTPDRRKVWLACSEHKQSLSDFLSARSFLRETTEV